jgi:hypothetical protein
MGAEATVIAADVNNARVGEHQPVLDKRLKCEIPGFGGSKVLYKV